MDLPTFLQQRRPDWKRLEEILQHVEGSGLSSLDDEQAVEFGRLYRRAASDLNQAQTFVSGEATERYLNDLVARAYLAIYGKTRIDVWGLLRYLFWGYPAVFRRYLPHLALATLLFAAGAIFGYLVSWYDKDAARAYLLPPHTIRPAEDGEDAAVPYDTDRLTEFSSFLFTHNVSVSLFAFALGITFGLGTAWMMFYNGVLTGVLAAVFVESHQLTAFATGILPHGVLEIPACLIGGAAGFVLAQGFLRARPWPRREELARQGKQAVLLLFGCVPLLAVAACLEAGVARAPDWFLTKGLKLAIAGVFGLLFLAYVALLGWKRSAEIKSFSREP
ncbi:MAG TPA: stage II sporulation protein M [Gemmataceae bacterium]|nr:stage II sporulation protein M [Gemmataceae bacterium]